jgi:hypothetical protein
MRQLRLVVVAALVLSGLVLWAHAEAPPLIAYQGALSDAAGKPANGTFSVTLSMYEGPTGGSAVWSEALANIPVSKGVFSVILGASTPLPMGLANCNFLEVSVNGKAMLPRQRLLSVPYALEAQNAQTLGGEPPSAFHDASNLTAGTIPKERLPGDLQSDTPQLVNTADIANGAVTTPKLANGAVTGQKIKPGTTIGGAAAGPCLTVTNSELDEGGLEGIGAEFGVSGRASAPTGRGVQGYATGDASSAGVFGANWGDGDGVYGEVLSGAGAAGVHGVAKARTGSTCGVLGETKSTAGGAAGVSGLATGTTGQVYGVYGSSASSSGLAAGVCGTSAGGSGVFGMTASTETDAAGVAGMATEATGKTSGVSGLVISSTNEASGVSGEASATSGATYGVRGITHSNGWEAAGVFGKNLGTQGKGCGVRGIVENGVAGVMGYAKTGGVGVWGATSASGEAGVYGFASPTTSAAFGVDGLTQSTAGCGVRGTATSPTGKTTGVLGVTESDAGTGVKGEAKHPGGFGKGVGVKGTSQDNEGTGVLGGGYVGVKGVPTKPNGTGVWGVIPASVTGGYGVYAQCQNLNGIALYVDAPKSQYGLWVESGGTHLRSVDCDGSLTADYLGSRGHMGCAGNLVVDVNAEVKGTLTCRGGATFTGYVNFAGGHGPPDGGDVAEHLRAEDVEAGDVVVIGLDGQLVKCSQEADTAVAGIVSTKPTLQVGSLQAAGGTAPLALVGVVPCKVDATKSPIRPGDLLVSSGTPGHAMKCTSKRPAAGTVIGKALEALESGKGTIQVLVTLR